MADQEQVRQIVRMLDEANPADFFKKFDEVRFGIGAVIRLLEQHGGHATAGQISEALGISTARVAVLIKKMTNKGLAEKVSDKRDARVTIVQLTAQGRQCADNMKQNLYRDVETLIDRIGIERVMEYIEISNIIKSVFACTPEKPE